MRTLAEELEVAPMALYRHVANKDDLIDAMIDLVFGEIDHELARVTCERLIALAEESDAPIRVLVSSPGGQFTLDSNELGVAKWVHEHHQPAGLGTSTLPGAAALQGSTSRWPPTPTRSWIATSTASL